jgi:hypothetical protein
MFELCEVVWRPKTRELRTKEGSRERRKKTGKENHSKQTDRFCTVELDYVCAISVRLGVLEEFGKI